MKETIEALNDSLDDNEEVYSNESKEDIESHPAYFIFSYPLGNHKIENPPPHSTYIVCWKGNLTSK